jgi:hypothetical protein
MSSGTTIEFLVHADGAAARQQVTLSRLVIAGWTGRDPVARDKHIAELEELGIPRPATTPIYYEVAASRLTTADAIEVSGGESSGEVEFVLVRAGGRLLVGVGSDHTDRKAETMGIALSKQLCAKVVGKTLWRLDEVERHWDQLILRAYVTIDGERLKYQDGPLSSMRNPSDLMSRAGGEAKFVTGTIMYCGTLGAIGGIRPAAQFAAVLVDPVLGREMSCEYAIEVLPVVR